MTPSRSFRPSTSRRWVPVAVVALALAGGGTWWLTRGKKAEIEPIREVAAPTLVRPGTVRYPDQAPQLSMLKTEVVKAGAVPLAEPLAARLVYDEDVTARLSASFVGRIVALKASPGDAVKAGQVLAELDSPDFGTASADLRKADADLEQKRQALERAHDLYRAEVIARKDFELAQADHAQARAEADRARLRLRNLMPRGGSVHGERLPLTSPVNGVVTERNATPAMEVNPSLPAPLFVVTDPRRLWVQIDLPEHLLAQVQVGGSVDVQVEAWPGAHFPARVIQVGLVVDPATRRIPVRAQVDNAGLKLRPEMFARAVLTRGAAGVGGTAFEVPNTALVNEGLYTAVFVETAPHEFSKRRVEVAVRGTSTSFIGSGLQPQERIVSQGALLLAAEMQNSGEGGQ